jgi:hypothetical protein
LFNRDARPFSARPVNVDDGLPRRYKHQP